MDGSTFKTPLELQATLGERIRRLRLTRGFDQIMTAEKAGISEKALRTLENGRGSTVETMLRTLKALDALDALDVLVPETAVNPIALLKTGKPPQRVRRRRAERAI
jgi:transcriptional regulator with XRE-family HTH domain